MREIRRIGFQVIPVSASDAAAKDGTDLITQIDVKYAAGGYIRSIVVAESSGSATLDEEALTIARGNRYPDVPKELQSRDFAVRFPIVFRPPRR
jgi:TonB family protein